MLGIHYVEAGCTFSLAPLRILWYLQLQWRDSESALKVPRYGVLGYEADNTPSAIRMAILGRAKESGVILLNGLISRPGLQLSSLGSLYRPAMPVDRVAHGLLDHPQRHPRHFPWGCLPSDLGAPIRLLAQALLCLLP